MANGDMARLFHRLTSYEPGRQNLDRHGPDPWIVTSFEPNDLELLPLTREGVLGRPCWLFRCRVSRRRRSTAHPRRWRGRRRRLRLWISPSWPDSLHLRPASCAPRNGRAAHSSSAPPGPQAAGSRWSCTSSCPTRCTTLRRACTPTGLSSTRFSSSALRRPERRPESTSPGCPGARVGVTANAAIATSSGTRGRCFRSCCAAASGRLPRPALLGLPRRRAARLAGADGIAEFPIAAVTLGDGPPGLIQHTPTTGGSVDESPVHFRSSRRPTGRA